MEVGKEFMGVSTVSYYYNYRCYGLDKFQVLGYWLWVHTEVQV